MNDRDTLLLRRHDVASLLTIEKCIIGVEEAFKLHAEGKAMPPGVLGIHANGGGFHIKAGILNLNNNYFVAKANANFPNNKKLHGLPTIQGIIVVCNAETGQLLALMDSIEITIMRTGAATAVAAKWLAPINAKTATICGCGNQGKISLRALMKVRKLETIYAFDIDKSQAERFAKELAGELQVDIIATEDLAKSVKQSDICITCTPSRIPFLKLQHIMPGTFIAAVGADNEDKQELETDLLVAGKLVVDLVAQAASIGELHHALQNGQANLSHVHAELGEVIAGRKTGRTSNKEIIIFDRREQPCKT
jgi:alanine dehydrogenase